MKNAPHADGVACLLAHAQEMRNRFAELANALRVAKGLAIPFVYDAALHDVGVTQPRVELTLLLDAGPIDQKWGVKQEHHKAIGKSRPGDKVSYEYSGQGEGQVRESVTSQGGPDRCHQPGAPEQAESGRHE